MDAARPIAFLQSVQKVAFRCQWYLISAFLLETLGVEILNIKALPRTVLSVPVLCAL
jgi:hypothetical protein